MEGAHTGAKGVSEAGSLATGSHSILSSWKSASEPRLVIVRVWSPALRPFRSRNKSLYTGEDWDWRLTCIGLPPSMVYLDRAVPDPAGIVP